EEKSFQECRRGELRHVKSILWMAELSKETLTGQAKRGFSGHPFFALPPRLIVFCSLSIGAKRETPASCYTTRERNCDSIYHSLGGIRFSLDSLHRKISQLDRINAAGCARSKVSNCTQNHRLENHDRIENIHTQRKKTALRDL